MDREWMRKQLEAFDDLAARYDRTDTQGYGGDQTLRDQVHRAEPTIKRILRRLDPRLAEAVDIDQMAGTAMARNEIQRALGILDDMDEWAVRLEPDAPTLAADQLHPWVWQAAKAFWETQHYRAAVHSAASAINAHLQQKLGRRDVADDKLIQEAFSSNAPEPGKSRLRMPGEPTDLTVQSRQRGALQLGLGCFFAIRNPAAHEPDEWGEQEALEQLAVLSVLARLVDDSAVAQ